MILNQVDEEALVKKAGYRNFASFVGIHYYAKKLSLSKCGELIGVSKNKMKTSMLKRGFSLRKRGPLPGTSSGGGRRINVYRLVRTRTPFIFPWCALHVYYEKYLLTTREIGLCLGVSQPFVCKLLKNYGIKARKRGKPVLERRKNGQKFA